MFGKSNRFMNIALAAFLAAFSAPAIASVFDLGFNEADLDLDACKTVHEGKATPADFDAMCSALGLQAGAKAWSAGPVSQAWRTETFYYVVAFKQPIEIGSVIITSGRFSYLKPDAAYPGDPAADDQWEMPDVHPLQSGGRVIALPAGVKTRVVRVKDVQNYHRSQLGVLRLLSARLHNTTPLAVANAEAEYTAWPDMAPPHTYAAADVTRGRGQWRNAGTDKQGRNLRPPVSDINPSWFVLSWESRHDIAGICMQDDFTALELYTFVGPDGVNPTVGTAREWKKQQRFTQKMQGGFRWIAFNEPVNTRGLKVQILKTSDPQVAWINSMNVLLDLGQKPVPKVPKSVDDNAPFVIPYSMPDEGKLTMAVDKPDGTRARNVVGLVERKQGPNQEYWDLKDESGNFVEPGTYKWKAITHKPLELRYEMTPYPNVGDNTPENSPWLNGHSGPGGWMADHTPPRAVCTWGDRVWLGSPVAESGVSLIECDLDGNKVWGHHSFAAFTGVWHLATDGKDLFIGAEATNAAGSWNVDANTDCVWAFDVATKALRDVGRFTPTNERQRGLQGMTARDGKLYMSINGTVSWMANAAQSADVDILNSVPRYPEKVKPRAAHQVTPDPRSDFIRLFRLRGQPPGHGVTVLKTLESTKGPGNSQHIVLAFNKPVALGSVAFPVPQGKDLPRVKLSVLKPDGKYPPNPDDKSQWIAFEGDGKLPWEVVPAPENTVTRALRISFVKGDDDVFTEIEDAKVTGAGMGNLLEADDDTASADADESKAWFGQLEGMKLFRRRFVNLFPTAKVSVNSGHIGKDNAWDAEREKPISAADPAIYMMEWNQPQSVRGLAIMEIDGEKTEIDVYTGPDDKPIDLAGRDGWEKVSTYNQPLRDYYQGSDNQNPHARYLDGYVDFGREVKTRAVRLRVVQQWTTKGHHPSGVRSDRGGEKLDPTRCRIYGVAPLRYIGKEAPIDPLQCERIEVVDAATRKIEKEIYIKKPADIAFSPAGDLFALSEGKVVKVDMNGKHEIIVADLKRPSTLAIDKAGQIYVFDGDGERKVVRVYDAKGNYLRDIGTPGGYKAGPWDPNRFEGVTAIDIDSKDQLWAVDWTYWPKRISQWTTDGKFKKEFLGPTAYGGGGVLDPWDKTRLFYGPLEFELNWEEGTTRLKNLTTWGHGGWGAGEVPIRIKDRTYLVTRPQFASMQCGIVYLYEKDRARKVAAVGLAGAFGELNTPEILATLGNKALNDFQFRWSDLNGDEKVQLDEVVLSPKRIHSLTNFNRDLGIQAGVLRYEVKEFLPNGAPVYEEKEFPLPISGEYGDGAVYRLNDGNFYRLGGGKRVPEAAFSPDGKMTWQHESEGSGVHALYSARPLHSAQVVAQFGWIGHETAHAGDLGEFVVFHSNVGTWNIWTSDGLLAGRIFRDIRDPKAQAWSMREHQRGLRLEEVTAGQEHFSGWFCRSMADNKYYVVAGHNHASVVEVAGIDKFKRLTGELKVTAEDIRKAQAWELEQQQKAVYAKAPVIDCFRLKEEVRIDGNADDWPGEPAAELEDGAALRIGYNDRYLFLCYDVSRMGPMKNSGNQWDRLFKTGASVDLQMGVIPSADAARKAPVEGDFRLLMTVMGGKPIAVLYKPVVPGTPAADAWEVVSPVFRVTFDKVMRLDDVRISVGESKTGYVLEAAVPLKTIGLKITPNLRLKMDWGVLVSGKDGNEVLRRVYWSNKATSITSDAPSEATLHPHLWGYVRFYEKDEKELDVLSPDKAEPDDKAKSFIDELEEDLK